MKFKITVSTVHYTLCFAVKRNAIENALGMNIISESVIISCSGVMAHKITVYTRV